MMLFARTDTATSFLWLLICMAGFWRGRGAVKGALRASPPLLSQRVP